MKLYKVKCARGRQHPGVRGVQPQRGIDCAQQCGESAPASGECRTQRRAVEDPLGYVDVPAGEPVHIAYWGVLSGADAPWARTPSRASRSPSTISAQFKGHDIRLTTEDGLCTPEGGATAATKLAADSTIVGLIGSACSDEVVGGIKTITEAGLTTISPSNTRPALTAEDRDATYAGYAADGPQRRLPGQGRG